MLGRPDIAWSRRVGCALVPSGWHSARRLREPSRVTIRLLRTLSSMVKAPLAPPGSALLVDLTGHKSTFAASELWAKSSAVIFVARRPG